MESAKFLQHSTSQQYKYNDPNAMRILMIVIWAWKA